jgi:hypothetical protein
MGIALLNPSYGPLPRFERSAVLPKAFCPARLVRRRRRLGRRRLGFAGIRLGQPFTYPPISEGKIVSAVPFMNCPVDGNN